MATRSMPTERQKRIGAELRKMRLAAGVTTEHAAGLLGIDRPRIANMESGVRPISSDRIRTLAANYACTDDHYVDALAAMASGRERGWWEKHRGTLSAGLLDIAELEWHAQRVRTVQVMHAPGLLQTEDYARAVFSAVLPALTRLEVELRVAHRMDRQQVFARSEPLPYVAYVHESALLMRFGGAEVTRRQLQHLCAESERSTIDVRVVPLDADGFPGAGHALLYADGATPRLDTVQLDSAHGPEFTHAEAQLAKYRAHLEWAERAALRSAASRDLIHKTARTL
ncbi:helix-turn-helix transcriptional regulator [Streptomyces sp. B-S-A8]|uniref:Helix-turn-helix transcriptional regulator n=1 Tax=Streptomyces solicavernae TaxID=3043614 RepID=A0ABT6RPZ4_9ACTN|nr:helix-turn-helix transcriptional regulator [Streptomyces sp. B-S-A8]MDI3386510.1 helix-turn-helix transcriptional regulator [Streptomyces sp. B-S-A8]